MMAATGTHTKTIEEPLTGDIIQPYWDKWFESEVRMWVAWHEYWLDKIEKGKVPVYFFRFEDLLQGPENVLKDIFRMVLAEPNIEETIIHQRIKDTISGGKNFLYKPRSAGGGFHKHVDKVTDTQMDHLMEKLQYLLHFFGYAKDDKNEK